MKKAEDLQGGSLTHQVAVETMTANYNPTSINTVMASLQIQDHRISIANTIHIR
jgi:hypothetical protein